jgi:hypothetical protein
MNDFTIILLTTIFFEVEIYFSNANHIDPFFALLLYKLFSWSIQGALKRLSQTILKFFTPTTNEKYAGFKDGESICIDEV